MLGSSRGGQDIGLMVDFLLEKKVNILFTLGGDGTQRGAERISQVGALSRFLWWVRVCTCGSAATERRSYSAVTGCKHISPRH